MLTPFDDFPVHQTSAPLARTVSGDRNHYDRYWFNGYTADGSLFFAVALGLYPNREVMDAAVSVVHRGVQTSLHASRRAPADRTTAVGPITVRVDDPLRRLTVSVAPNESGITGALTFAARTVACEEPHFVVPNLGMDYTRLTQFGRWEGALTVGGNELPLVGAVGTRDRSWGVRPVGERDVRPPGPLPQICWQWIPVNFDDVCTHADFQEDADGRPSHRYGVVLPVIEDGAPVTAPVEPMMAVERHIDWRPGTRRADRAVLTMTALHGEERVIELTPMLDFQMCGLGYLHPAWGHGMWKGEEVVGTEVWDLAELDPMAPQNLHVQQLCRATMGARTGTGVLELLIVGPHRPSGFRDLLDPA
ncbi:MAG TPA: hypothetical protein VGI06_14735 [Acidimicrobiales bacterium]|jgi:hypothetical protein